MKYNRGYDIQEAMQNWFRGKSHPSDCVDFQTTKSLYEVKSCKLFTKCVNGNHKRAYANKPHKKIITTQMGRFFVKLKNHNELRVCAEKENKIPKYILVIVIGKQKIWRVKSWEKINSMMRKRSRITPIRIKDLFNEVWRDK